MITATGERRAFVVVQVTPHRHDGVETWHGASEQSHKQVFALRNYLTSHHLGAPFISDVIWLRQVANPQLPPRPHNLLGASLTWGLADFFGPLQGRALGALRTLVYVQLGGLVAIALIVSVRAAGPHDAAALLENFSRDLREPEALRHLARTGVLGAG